MYSAVGDATGLTVYDNRLSSPDGVVRVFNVETIRFLDQDADVGTDFLGVLLFGTEFDDDGAPGNPPSLVGTILNDQINGLAGNDRIEGLAGLDLLIGGQGDDTIDGGGQRTDADSWFQFQIQRVQAGVRKHQDT